MSEKPKEPFSALVPELQKFAPHRSEAEIRSLVGVSQWLAIIGKQYARRRKKDRKRHAKHLKFEPLIKGSKYEK